MQGRERRKDLHRGRGGGTREHGEEKTPRAQQEWLAREAKEDGDA